ncbi:proline/glycine betaine ABC transporter permease [Aureimonas fodinaquatilis]|uniref:Proline/glycine betaine ABC transporter permease n=1 Tax=Aureimonas fodinaquatilis TaxID=2565783 RepID=A0A5B0DPR2_9HYPH|nr:proline/glycine betaine ABC transporter permease [Aureimonas fodinaquatilis]KAA0968466.1 proline/glycine betaine ABC transporter permease [Aureimonas fodinaquatilis]
MDWTVPKFPLDRYSDELLSWLTTNFSDVTRGTSRIVRGWIENGTALLTSAPPLLVIAVIALLAWWLAGRRVGLLSLAGFLFLWNLRLWQATMETIVLVLLATLAALTIGIPIGIICALSKRVWKLVGPLLDMMQTMPSFVYLIPAIPFFGLGSVSAVFATIIFSMPPVIRLTALGILSVPRELIEASDAFGSTPMQKLFKVQLPLALPTIMAGINQTIMLSLSMVVIASMIGAGGLGREVWRAIQRLDAGAGFQAGIAIVIVAVVLDRITQAMAHRARPS